MSLILYLYVVMNLIFTYKAFKQTDSIRLTAIEAWKFNVVLTLLMLVVEVLRVLR